MTIEPGSYTLWQNSGHIINQTTAGDVRHTINERQQRLQLVIIAAVRLQKLLAESPS